MKGVNSFPWNKSEDSRKPILCLKNGVKECPKWTHEKMREVHYNQMRKFSNKKQTNKKQTRKQTNSYSKSKVNASRSRASVFGY